MKKKVAIIISLISVVVASLLWMNRGNLIQLAVRANNPVFLNVLLKAGFVDPNFKDKELISLPYLIYVYSSDRLNFLEVLIENGISRDDGNVLGVALMFHDYDAVKLIAENKFKIFPDGLTHQFFFSIPEEMIQKDMDVAHIVSFASQNGEDICQRRVIESRNRQVLTERMPHTKAVFERICGPDWATASRQSL